MTKRCPHLKPPLWMNPDDEIWPSIRRHPRGRHCARWSKAHWGCVEEAYGCFQGWLQNAHQSGWSIKPGQRCTRERLRAYIEYMKPRLAPHTVVKRVVDLGCALSILDPGFDRQAFTHATRHLRRLARKQRRQLRIPHRDEFIELG